jgi:hypothetical protein
MEIIDIIYREYYSILESKKSINDLISNDTINEQFDFGYYTVDRYGSAIIKNTPRIESPINGKIKNSLSPSSCQNSVVVVSDDEEYFLEYCNISNVIVTNNSKVKFNDLLGQSNPSDDVKVTLYNKRGKKVKIDSDDANKLISKSYNKKDDKNKEKYYSEYKKDTRTGTTAEPLISGLFQLPFKALAYPFKNKYDKSGRMTQKRWGSPVDKTPVEKGWIFKALADPLGKKRKKEEVLDENEKLNEQIKKIKQLIK